jgi:hypothetical protein
MPGVRLDPMAASWEPDERSVEGMSELHTAKPDTTMAGAEAYGSEAAMRESERPGLSQLWSKRSEVRLSERNGSRALYDSGISFDHLYRTNATPPYKYAQSRIITVNEQGLSAIINLYKGQPYSNPIIKIQGEGVVDAFKVNNGTFAGLRTKTRVISSTGSSSSPNQLSNLDHEILVNLSSGTCYIKVPSSPLDGQEYIVTTKGANITLISSSYNMYSIKDNNTSLKNSFNITMRGTFRVKYFAGASQWVFSWIDKYED